jgi:hypothetical protein
MKKCVYLIEETFVSKDESHRQKIIQDKFDLYLRSKIIQEGCS